MLSIPRRAIIAASSVALILFIALTLATSIEVRAQQPQIIQVSAAQAARIGNSDEVVAAKALLNGTAFDRGDILQGTSTVSGISLPTEAMNTEEGMIGFTPTPEPSASWSGEGVIGSISTPTPTSSAVAKPQPPPSAQLPILALTYSGAGGPKHCRGDLLSKTQFTPPVERWKEGTCINLPGEARCGVFFSNKGDNCEAQLFNEVDCYNTTRTYINTVVFMPEERAVGGLWSSMWVRCGVDVPEAKMLDPSILGGALRKPGS
jgi:hypothetical protein